MRNMCTGVQRRDCDWHPLPNISCRSSALGPLSGLRWVHADDVIENKYTGVNVICSWEEENQRAEKQRGELRLWIT